ncbi:hypothetical protein [Halomarina oriensis]|uniref:Uncharacterized protein n=1 Tax=Halomarina oriensis TaxID=671145 RepID=A0A6B0GUY1_9EURY|nr:hypothetical protein [Halomarina oriensis]MWG35528.1 hypothetical protein [Halomarina oriensis]
MVLGVVSRVGLLGGWTVRPLLDLFETPGTAPLVSALVIVVGFAVASWLAYFGGATVLRHTVRGSSDA